MTDQSITPHRLLAFPTAASLILGGSLFVGWTYLTVFLGTLSLPVDLVAWAPSSLLLRATFWCLICGVALYLGPRAIGTAILVVTSPLRLARGESSSFLFWADYQWKDHGGPEPWWLRVGIPRLQLGLSIVVPLIILAILVLQFQAPAFAAVSAFTTGLVSVVRDALGATSVAFDAPVLASFSPEWVIVISIAIIVALGRVWIAGRSPAASFVLFVLLFAAAANGRWDGVHLLRAAGDGPAVYVTSTHPISSAVVGRTPDGLWLSGPVALVLQDGESLVLASRPNMDHIWVVRRSDVTELRLDPTGTP